MVRLLTLLDARQRSRACTAAILCLGNIGCPASGPTPDGGTVLDAGDLSDGGFDDEDECALALTVSDVPVPSPWPIAQGVKRQIDVVVTSNLSSYSIDVNSTGIALELALDDGVLSIRAPYGVAGEATIDVTATCGQATASANFVIEVDAIEWEQLATWTAGQNGPVGREYFPMWIDSNNEHLWLFGGFHYEPVQFTPENDVWRFDLDDETWELVSPVNPPPKVGGGGLAKSPAGELLYLGGLGKEGDDLVLPFSLVRFIETAVPDFTAVTPTGVPSSGFYQPAFFYDQTSDQFMMVGGSVASGVHMDAFSLSADLTTWSSAETAAANVFGDMPTERTGFFWVYDAEGEQLVLFSGDQGPTPSCDCATDTWALDLAVTPPTWRKIAEDNPPLPRRNGAYAIDTVGRRMFIWGGTGDGQTARDGIFALSLERGAEKWEEVVPEGTLPPSRSSGAMVFDELRNRLVMGFGNGAAVYADLWVLNL